MKKLKNKAVVNQIVFFFIIGALLTPGNAQEWAPEIYRIGFTSYMFTDVNENDAKAAVKIWGEQIAREHNIPTDPVPVILKDMDVLTQVLQNKQVDAVGITTIEYEQLHGQIKFSPLLVTSISGSISERYVLLARRDGPVKTLGDLGGRTLVFYDNPRACLAPMWLDTRLIRKGHPASIGFAGKIFRVTKLGKAVLPVFFCQADACLVTRRGFDTMAELNPQLARELNILSESPELVPALFVFRADYNSIYKEKIISGMTGLKQSAAGQQVLTIFQSDDLLVQPLSCLDTSIGLITEYKQLVSEDQHP